MPAVPQQLILWIVTLGLVIVGIVQLMLPMFEHTPNSPGRTEAKLAARVFDGHSKRLSQPSAQISILELIASRDRLQRVGI